MQPRHKHRVEAPHHACNSQPAHVQRHSRHPALPPQDLMFTLVSRAPTCDHNHTPRRLGPRSNRFHHNCLAPMQHRSSAYPLPPGSSSTKFLATDASTRRCHKRDGSLRTKTTSRLTTAEETPTRPWSTLSTVSPGKLLAREPVARAYPRRHASLLPPMGAHTRGRLLIPRRHPESSWLGGSSF